MDAIKGKETEFMKELHDIFRKYSIDTVAPMFHGGEHIIFMSNGNEFSFSDYSAGSFHTVNIKRDKYTPYMEDDDK